MSTVISEMLVKIGADIAGLKSDMDAAKKAVENGAFDMERAANLAKTALVGLVGVASVGAGWAMINKIVEATGAINDLSIKTGASAAALMAFKSVGATTETSVDSVAGAMNKLSKSMSDAGTDGGKVGVAVNALGLDFTTFKNLKPEQQMLAVATAMGDFEDGAGKTAVAMTLFGKSGADLLPFLKDLGDQADKVNDKLTDQQIELAKTRAEMSDAYGDNLTEINRNMNGWQKDMAFGLLPVMYEVSETIKKMSGEGGLLGGAIKKLAEDGTLADWARGAVTALSYIVDVFQGIFSIIPIVGKAIAGLAAATSTAFGALADAWIKFQNGDFEGTWNSLKSGFEGVKEVGKATGSDISSIWNQKLIGETFRDTMSGLGKIETAGGKAKGKLVFDAEADKNAAALKKQNEEIDKFVAGILATQSGLSSDYFDTMAKLETAFKTGKLTQDEYNTAVGDLIKKQPVVKKQAEEQKKAQDDLEKTYAAVATASSKYEKALFDETDQIRKANIELKDQNEKAGLNASQLAAREAKLLRQQAEEKEWTALMTDDGTGSNWALKEQARLLRERADELEKGTAVKEAKAAADEWAKTTKSIEDGLTDALMLGFESGKGFMDSLKDYITNAFKNFVANFIIRPVMAPIAGAISSMFGGNAMAGTGAGGGGSIMSAIGNFFNGSAIGGAFGNAGAFGAESIGNWLVNNTTGGLNSLGGSLMQNSGLIGQGLGMFGNGMAGYGISKMLSGGYSAGGWVNGLAGIASAIPGIGPIAGVVGGLVNRAFGRKPKEMKDFGVEGSISGGDATGQTYQDWFQKGGWFRSNKSGTDYSAMNDDMAAAFDLGAKGILTQTKAWAAALNLPADALSDVTTNFRVKLTDDAEANQEAINTVFQNYGEDLAQQFAPVLAPFQKAGETMSETLSRLAALSTFSESFNELGGIFSRVAGSSIQARENLIALAGGIDQLMAQAGQFVQDYYNEGERAGMQARDTLALFKQLGIDGGAISSRNDFRALVESIDVSTEVGQRQLAALLRIAPNFAGLADYLRENELTLQEVAEQAPAVAVLDQMLPEQAETTDAVGDVAGAIKTGNETLTKIQTAIETGNLSIASGLAAMTVATNNVAALQAQVAASSAATARAVSNNSADAALANAAPTYNYDIGSAGA